jgi:diadenosine tetraphosphate (Ap4A) HIT family hydrolase
MIKPHSEITGNNHPCSECGFSLYNYVMSFGVSHLGIYNDNRFPGRSILLLDKHEEQVDEMDEELYLAFCGDIRKAVKILKEATGSQRINVSILGNTESHIHAHLIPRFPENEEFPGKSPWNDKRTHLPLSDEHLTRLKNGMTAYLL